MIGTGAPRMSSRPSVSQVKASKSRKSLTFDNGKGLTHGESKVTSGISRAIARFDRRGLSNFSKLNTGVASSVLAAYLGFRDPRKRRREYLIPKDKAAWLEWLVFVARKRINVEYLTDKELRKVIIRARPNLSPKKGQGQVEDPALPPCMAWNANEVGDWIVSLGFPQLRETFVKNMITGRRLVLIDCNALNKMGMTDLTAMREVAGAIRTLLGTPSPNGLRPLMRIPPYERFLQRKVYNGRNYDELTFEKYCNMEGFNYDMIEENKNAQIPCTCEVLITTKDQAEEGSSEEDEDEEHSLKNAPTVEYLVRNALIRNKIVDQIMSDILENVFLPPRERRYGKEVWGSLKRSIGEGYDDLHLYFSKDKLEFASGVAHHLIDELYRTVAIMNDISQLEKHVKDNITEEDKKMCEEGAAILLEEAAPIAALMALGELDLESIFRREPTFERYVDGIIKEAENRTNVIVPDATSFVDEVIDEAWRKIPDMNLTGLDPELKRSILRMANEVLYGISEEREDIVGSVMNSLEGAMAGGLAEEGKQDKTGNVSSSKGTGGGVTFSGTPTGGKGKAPPVKQPQQGKSTPSQLQVTGAEGKSNSRQAIPTESQESKEQAVDEGNNESLAKKRSSNVPRKSLQRASQSQEDSRRTLEGDKPPGTGESGSNSDNKPTEAPGAKGKGKGKKHKKGENPAASSTVTGPPGGGEGEGSSVVASEAVEAGQNDQNFTVQSMQVSRASTPNTKRITIPQAARPTSVSLTLGSGERERRNSPLPRSPMTVKTPTSADNSRRDSPLPRSPRMLGTVGRLLTGEMKKTRESFGSSEGYTADLPAIEKRRTTVLVRALPPEEVENAAAAHGIKPPTPGKISSTKIRRMSKEQDKKLQPPLQVHVDAPKEIPMRKLSIAIHGQGQKPPPDVSPRQGKLQPPSQQEYNQEKEIVEQEQHRIQEVKPGVEVKPAIYHQRKGALDTTPKFGSEFEPEELPPLQRRGVDQSQENGKKEDQNAEKKTNFVLIPKTVKPRGSGGPSPGQPQPPRVDAPPPQPSVPKPSPKLQIHAATTEMPQTLTKVDDSSQSPQGRKESTISVSAQEIWDQMKEQYEKGKSAEGNKRPQTAPAAEAVAASGETQPQKEELTLEEIMKQGAALSPYEDVKLNKKRTLMSTHTEFVIDPEHLKEMKHHRETVVEDWARKHSDLAVDDKDERTRLVRMTADKVITEICTMALTHLLQEAEAGKNTQKIMDTLRKMKRDPKQEKTPYDITLWESSLDPRHHHKQHSSSHPDSDAPRTTASGTRLVVGLAEAPGKLPLRSILHTTGDGPASGVAGERLKSHAKSVVVKAVKDAFNDPGITKPTTK